MAGSDRASYAMGFADLDRRSSSIVCRSKARCRRGCRARFCAPGPRSSTSAGKPSITGSTASPCCTGSASPAAASPTATASCNRTPTARPPPKGALARGEFATDPCRTLFQRVAAIFEPKLTDNCNVNINPLGGAAGRLHRDDAARALRRRDAGDARRLWLRPADRRQRLDRASPPRRPAQAASFSYVVEFGRRAATGCSPSTTTAARSASSPRCRSTARPTCTASP